MITQNEKSETMYKILIPTFCQFYLFIPLQLQAKKKPNKMNILKILSGLILILVFTSKVLSAQERPNIIFLLSDDQTAIATGCYGNPQVQTPNMDKLAEEGVMFMNHYNTTAICMASRVSIMTGMYEYKAGCNFMHGPLKPEKFDKTYPVILRNEGYYTGFAGKFGFAVSEGESWDDNTWDVLPVHAFDEWAGGLGQTNYKTKRNKYIAKYADEFPHSTRAYGAWADDFIKNAVNSSKPFCMSISFKAPHLPFTPDPFFDNVYAGIEYKKPANYGAESAKHLAPQAKTGRQYNAYDFWRESDETYQDAIQSYNQLIYGVDYAIGIIQESLKKYGVDDNTIIIFTGDNGYSCGAHNFGGKVLPYEESSKTSLIIFDPRLPKDQRGIQRDAVTANIDMAPTIMCYAGIKALPNMDGLNLMPLVKNKEDIKRKSITLMNAWGNDEIQTMGVVTKDWKYIYWQYSDERMNSTEELFNVENDSLEMHNLASDKNYSERLKIMRKIYDKHWKHLRKNVVPYHDYEKYKILFARDAQRKEKVPYMTGTYKEIMERPGKKPLYKIR
jgi:arylsulfatase A-like enzyme